MAISFVDSATNEGSSSSPSVSKPAGLSVGDVVILALHINGPKTSTDNNGSAPFSEVLVDRSYNGPSAQVDLYYRVIDGTEGSSFSFTLSSSDRWCIGLLVFRGVHSSIWDVQPTSTTENTGTGSTNTTDSLVTVTNGAMAVAFAVNDSNTLTFTATPGDSFTTPINNPGTQLLSMSYKEIPTATTQSAISWTQSSSNGTWLNNIFALKPAGGTTHTKTYTDAFSLTESFVKSTTKLLSDTNTLTSTLLKSEFRTLSDTSTLTDTLLKNLQRTLNDAITTADSIVRSITKLSSDTVTVVDELFRNIERTLTDSSTLTDSIINARERVFTDAISVADSIIRSAIKVVFETISLTETLIRSATRTLSDVSTLTEVFVGQISGYFKVFVDTIILTDTITNILDKFYDVVNWIKAWFGPNKPTSVVGDDKPNSVVNDNNPVQMSSGDDTPTGSILSSDRPTKV